MITLFIYGTLMRGEASHHLLEGRPCLGPATTAPGYALYQIEWYPGMVAEAGAGVVQGELYALDPADPLWPKLDEYEDVPELYQRRPVPLADGREAVAYVLHGRHAAGRPRLSTGDWRKRNTDVD